jgi:23S rRNA pseudouridine1911/1915/1917 synthase
MPKEEDALINYLKEKNTYFVCVSDKGEKAITSYKVIKTKNNASLLDVEIKTGKKHQIRVQLSNINHPIIGDKKYGGRKHNRLMLHAYYLKFTHPITKDIIEIIDDNVKI